MIILRELLGEVLPPSVIGVENLKRNSYGAEKRVNTVRSDAMLLECIHVLW